MIYLITGAIGTGKTTFVVDQLMSIDAQNKKFIEEGNPENVKKIYSNIDGLQVDHEPLPDDWRDTPQNSIIAIDECHKFDIYKPNRKQLHDDERIIALNESRHTGHDIYFITQAPKFLHSHVRGLCNKHYHFHNPMGLAASTVFVWRHGNTLSPDNASSKNLAEDTFVYQFKKSVQKNFKSIEDDAKHTRKVKIPKKVIFWVSMPFILIAFMIYLFTKPETTGNLTGETFINSSKNSADTLGNIGSTMPKNLDPNAVNSQGQTTEQTQQTQQSNAQRIAYDPTKPYEVDYTNYQYSASTAPQFAGCISTKIGCTCYTQQATKIEVKQDVCLQAIKQLPFNPFKNEQQQAEAQPTPNIYETMARAEEQKIMAEFGYNNTVISPAGKI